MIYRLPSDEEIIKLILARSDESIEYPRILKELYQFIESVDTAIVIANLNSKENQEYLHYLKYLRRYAKVSYENPNSSLSIKLVDHYKLLKLHSIL